MWKQMLKVEQLKSFIFNKTI